MTDTTKTPRFRLPYLDPSQSQPEVKINEAWDIIDANLGGGGSDTGSDIDSGGGGGSGSITVIGVDSPAAEIFNVTTLRFDAIVESETGGVAVIRGLAAAPDSTGIGRPMGAYFVMPGGGAITLPVNAVEALVQSACTIQEIIILTKGGAGSCVIKLWKAAFSSHYPPVVTDDITGGANVNISSGTTHQDSTLTGFTKTLAQDDVVLITLASCSVFTSVAVYIRVG